MEAGIVAFKTEDETNVVTRGVPSKAVTEVVTNPFPFTVTAVSPVPAITEGGDTLEIDGMGLEILVTVIVADPVTLVYPGWVEFAMHVAVPTPLGVNTPLAVIVPPVADHVTPVLNAPVP